MEKNKTTQLLDFIQFKTGMDLGQIAEKLGRNRTYLSQAKSAKDNHTLVSLIETVFADVLGGYQMSKKAPPDPVTRRWEKYVKDELGIAADLYSLKHLNTSETVEQLGEGLAAMHNSHTSTAMVRNVYDVGRESREHEKIKSLKNEF